MSCKSVLGELWWIHFLTCDLFLHSTDKYQYLFITVPKQSVLKDKHLVKKKIQKGKWYMTSQQNSGSDPKITDNLASIASDKL